MHRRVVGVPLFERLGHHLHRFALPAAAFGLVDPLTTGRHLPAPVGEVALRRDPVIVERHVGVLEERQRHLGAVARRHDGLVGFLGDATGRVQSLDARPAALVGVNVRLRAAVDKADVVGVVEVVGVGPGGDDDVVGPEVELLALDAQAEPLLGRL